ncbi:MAG: CDP-diacylglycerol--serine O-phosphatidyltransferase [Cytophagales bacterium]|nr:CDP-diacylglycerol--serine O-phosphatidyltransferase [Cytophagales bacterium]
MKRHIPNLITSLNLLTGVLGIIWVFQENVNDALIFVIIAGIFDFFDGFAARLLKVQSPIGKELDSLADMISFSAFPALFLFIYLQNQYFEIAPYAALLIAPFSAMRLAIFNTDDQQADKFIGLPTPANAIFITSLPLMNPSLPEWAWILLAVASSLIMVAPIEMIALKFKNYSLKDNLFRYVLIVFSITLLLVFGVRGLVLVIPGYILLSVFSNFFRVENS